VRDGDGGGCAGIFLVRRRLRDLGRRLFPPPAAVQRRFRFSHWTREHIRSKAVSEGGPRE